MRKKLWLLLVLAVISGGVYAIHLWHKQSAENENATLVQDKASAQSKTAKETAFSDKIDMSQWLYNEEHGVYYQLQIPYCAAPADEKYEKLAVFVPQAFFNCTKNDEKTYSCVPNGAAKIADYTIHTAPWVMSLESTEYSSVLPLSEYRYVSKFMQAGFVYVHAGYRGIEHGAPADIADLKAAIRFIRRNKSNIPANVDLLYVFGVDSGGGQGAVLGASGDSSLYKPYLQAIGAIEGESDEVHGVMAWSPLTGFESANEAYEWSMGYTRKGLTQNQHELSNHMARAYVDYVNNAGFRDKDNNPLILQYSERGIYQNGSYYDYVKSTIEKSLSEFLRDTKFPFTPPREQYYFGQFSDEKKEIKSEINPQGTFLTRRQYLKALNLKRKWVEYDFFENKATIRSVADFMYSFKPTTKNIGAFDGFNRQQTENKLFAVTPSGGVHYDELTMNVLKNHPKAQEFRDDLLIQDKYGITVKQRRDMYSPLYYLLPSSSGFRSSKVAKFWRIRSGINQAETALTTEINLYLAAVRYPGVKNANFKAIWGAGHIRAEEKFNNPDDAFIRWINSSIGYDIWHRM